MEQLGFLQSTMRFVRVPFTRACVLCCDDITKIVLDFICISINYIESIN